MLRRIFVIPVCAVMSVASFSKVDAQSDSAKSWIPSFVGGDLFFSGEIFGIHLLDHSGYLTTAGGIGAELRLRDLFCGALIGNRGDEGLPDFSPAGTFSFYSLYAGVAFKGYRVEIGEIHGDNASWIASDPHKGYTVAFIGASRRWGDVIFFEPSVKLIFPVVANSDHYMRYFSDPSFPPIEYAPFTEFYHIRDLFFGFSLKAGVGFN